MFQKTVKLYLRGKYVLRLVPEYIRTLSIDFLSNILIFWLTLMIVSGLSGPEDSVRLILITAIYSLIMALVKPVLLVISAPLILFSLGTFIMIINILMLYLTSWVAAIYNLQLNINSFVTAILAGLLITFLQYIFKRLINTFDLFVSAMGDRGWILELERMQNNLTEELARWKVTVKEQESTIRDQKIQISNLERERALLAQQNQNLETLE
jgi:putative membrane protein